MYLASSASEAVASARQPAFATPPKLGPTVLVALAVVGQPVEADQSRRRDAAETTTVGMTLTCNFWTKNGDAASIFIILHSCLGPGSYDDQ